MLTDATWTANIMAPHTDTQLTQQIYADWLEERGDNRCEVIRTGIEIANRHGMGRPVAIDNAIWFLKFLAANADVTDLLGRDVSERERFARWLIHCELPVVRVNWREYQGGLYYRPLFFYQWRSRYPELNTPIFEGNPVAVSHSTQKGHPELIAIARRIGMEIRNYPTAEEKIEWAKKRAEDRNSRFQILDAGF